MDGPDSPVSPLHDENMRRGTAVWKGHDVAPLGEDLEDESAGYSSPFSD